MPDRLLESYCLARARSSQVIVRHHKVAQLGAAFRYASAEALKSDAARPFWKEMEQIFCPHLNTTTAKELLSSFAERDDSWWIGVLRKIRRDSGDLLGASLGLVLEREPSLKSIWKRKGQLTIHQRNKINKFKELSNLAESGKQILGLRKNSNVLLVIHSFKPYSTLPGSERSQMMVRTENGLKSASELSPLIKSLLKAWHDDLVHVHAFALKSSTMNAEKVIEQMTMVSPSQGFVKPISANSRKVRTKTKVAELPRGTSMSGEAASDYVGATSKHHKRGRK